jgi:hypothetical protein
MLTFETTTPNKLLAEFKKAIDDGKVKTWSYDGEGDFTHTPEQWRGKAWLRPVVATGRLTMKFLGKKSEVTTKEVYGIYHGRFIESMLVHCDGLFTQGYASALPTGVDSITTKVA